MGHCNLFKQQEKLAQIRFFQGSENIPSPLSKKKCKPVDLWRLEPRPGGAPRLPLKANNCASSTWHMGHHLHLSADLEGREPGGAFMRKTAKT